MKIFSFLILFVLTSCAGYVDQIHRQIDREEKMARGDTRENMKQHYMPYKSRFDRSKDKRPIKDPRTFSLSDGGPSGQIKPAVKRDYRPQRMKAEDFIDGGEESGSLWVDQGSSSSLFTYQNDKHTGDIVIINVLENLRNQISAELKRTFPDAPKRLGQGGPGAPGAPANPNSAAPAANDNEMDMKIYDKISGTVMEEISKDYILLSGRKEVIFKKEKRSIEVQGLVSRKDIMENDYVNSDKMLDSRVFILK